MVHIMGKFLKGSCIRLKQVKSLCICVCSKQLEVNQVKRKERKQRMTSNDDSYLGRMSPASREFTSMPS